MNELNIYAKFNYRKVLKSANLHFNNKYHWYKARTVFAPKNGFYLVSLNRWRIRICYWDEQTEQGTIAKDNLKAFIEDNFKEKQIGVSCTGKCEILNELTSVKAKRIR